MSLISRVEMSNYLTEGLESNHFADWNPMLTGITLRMDGKSALVNITNGGGKTSMAELLLYLLSRDRTLLSHLRDKTAPKGRGYTHARIEFRSNDESSYREPGLLEIDVDNLSGATHVIGVALNNDIADSPIFYSYSGTLEDSPCYTKNNGRLVNTPDADFVRRTRSMPQSKWDKFSNAREWQDHVGLFISMDVVRRNATYQAKGSDDKNASFFNFKPRNGESYDSAFFKAVIAPDLLTNLLNSFSEENESSIEDTLHISLSHIVNSERDIARKQANLERREAAIEVDLKPVVDSGAKANTLHTALQTSLRGVKKDVALLHHFGSQESPHAIAGLPRPLSSLLRTGDQDARIRQAVKGMVISRDDGLLIRDKTFGELSGVEIRRVGEIADRKRIPNSSLNSQVIDFACDFGFSTSGSIGGGHVRKGYSRLAVAQLLPLLAGTQGATLDGLEDVFKSAFDIAQSQIETNPASLKILVLEATLSANEVVSNKLSGQSDALAQVIDGMDRQIKGREDNEAAWHGFSAIASQFPDEVRSTPKQAKDWIEARAKAIRSQLADMHRRSGELAKAWGEYQVAIEQSGLEGIQGIRTRHDQLISRSKEIQAQIKSHGKKVNDLRGRTATLERATGAASTLLDQCNAALTRMDELERGHTVFQGYFGDVDPIAIDHPLATLKNVGQRKTAADEALRNSSAEWDALCGFKAGASRFNEIFGAEVDPFQCDPVRDHREWSEKSHEAQQGLQPLEPLVSALSSFELRFPKQTPSSWMAAADARRNVLEAESRDATKRKQATEQEIEALDRLALVDDASFAQAWALLGSGPQRLYAFLQDTPLPLESRVAALSALSGLLSAPVFDSLADMDAASTVLDQHGVTIPLLLKEPLLQAIQSQGTMHGELRLMGFFAGRYSRKVRILLEPEFAQRERELLVQQVGTLQGRLDQIAEELPQVDHHSADYGLAKDAAKAIQSNCVARFEQFKDEFELADAALARLAPQTKKEALACLDSRRNFLKKGGEEKQTLLWDECEVLRQQVSSLKDELFGAEKRASPESVEAYLDALKYVKEGSETGHESTRTKRDKAATALDIAQWELTNHNDEFDLQVGQLDSANEAAQMFDDENGADTISKLGSVLGFSVQGDNIEFMQGFNQQSGDLDTESSRLIAIRSTVNFDRAADYIENLDKSDTELVNEIASKKAELNKVTAAVEVLRKRNEIIRDFELPNWETLRKAIHEFAYEMGSQAVKTKKAHAEFHRLEEGASPAEAHPLYASIDALNTKIRAATIDETSVLATLLSEETFKLQDLNPQVALDEFLSHQRDYNAALADYSQKNKTFCEKAREDSGTKLAAFNALELDEIERSTPGHIATLVSLFERLNLSLNKDRDDANKAIQAAHNANEEALTQLSRLIQVAEDNLDALKKVMSRYQNGCFKIKVQLAGEGLIKEILSELKDKIKLATVGSGDAPRTLRRSDETRIKELLRETLIDKIFLEPKVTFIHSGIRNKESVVTDKLSTGQKVALEFMWIVRQAEYEIERGLRELSSKQAERMRVKTNRVIFVDGIFSTLSDRRIIREAFSGLGNLGGNFQIIGFLHSPTWTNDSSVFPVYHVGKKLMNSSGSSLVAFSEQGRDKGTLGFFTSISQEHENAV